MGAAVAASGGHRGPFWIRFGEGPSTVEIVLKQPYSPLLNLLAFPNGSPQIMPKRVATAPDPLKDFTGTGPFKLIEYKPDTWVRVGKFAQYVSPPGARTAMSGGASIGRRNPLPAVAQSDDARRWFAGRANITGRTT